MIQLLCWLLVYDHGMVLQKDGILESIYLGLLRRTGIDKTHEFLRCFGGGGIDKICEFPLWFGGGEGAQVLLVAPIHG